MQPRINKKILNDEISRYVVKEIERKTLKEISKKVKEYNFKLLEEFLRNEITKEIKSGPNASNISGTLRGKGNLFSFLGFNENDDPIGKLIPILKNSIKIKNTRKSYNNYTLTITITIPSKEDLDEFASLPWVEKSWITAIEQGISGLGQYLYSEKGFKKSRSGKGVQISTTEIKTSNPTPYISKIIQEISRQLILSIKQSF